MIWEGMLLEGLTVTRAVQDRYGTAHRNPSNEIECGDHYARSMASCGVFLAACGFKYNRPKQHISFVPRLSPENFKCACMSAEGWSAFSQKTESGKLTAEIAVRWGRLNLKTLALESATGNAVSASHGERRVAAKLARDGKRILISFETAVAITAGEKLEIVPS